MVSSQFFVVHPDGVTDPKHDATLEPISNRYRKQYFTLIRYVYGMVSRTRKAEKQVEN